MFIPIRIINKMQIGPKTISVKVHNTHLVCTIQQNAGYVLDRVVRFTEVKIEVPVPVSHI